MESDEKRVAQHHLANRRTLAPRPTTRHKAAKPNPERARNCLLTGILPVLSIKAYVKSKSQFSLTARASKSNSLSFFWHRNNPEGVKGRTNAILQTMGCRHEYTPTAGGKFCKELAFSSQEDSLIAHISAFKTKIASVLMPRADYIQPLRDSHSPLPSAYKNAQNSQLDGADARCSSTGVRQQSSNP